MSIKRILGALCIVISLARTVGFMFPDLAKLQKMNSAYRIGNTIGLAIWPLVLLFVGLWLLKAPKVPDASGQVPNA